MNRIWTGSQSPLFVGAYSAHGARHFLPMSRLELDRATNAARRWLASFQFAVGSNVIVSSSTDVAAQFIPFDQATVSLGLVPCSTDSGAGEASRVTSIARRFNPVGIAVPDAEMLAAMDIETVLGGKIVWVRPDAFGLVNGVPGIVARRWIEIGPMTAIECSAGRGAHFDRYEWDVETDDGELVLTSRLPRSLSFNGWQSGVRAKIERSPCSCGCPDSRVILDE